MTMEMTADLQQALDQSAQPVQVVDPRTSQAYVLVRANIYERIRTLFEDVPLSRDDQSALLRMAGRRAGWNDPEMDVYDHLDPRKTL